MKLIIKLYLLWRLKMRGDMPPFPTSFHDVTFDKKRDSFTLQSHVRDFMPIINHSTIYRISISIMGKINVNLMLPINRFRLFETAVSQQSIILWSGFQQFLWRSWKQKTCTPVSVLLRKQLLWVSLPCNLWKICF